MSRMRISRVGPDGAAEVHRAKRLFDHPVQDDATARFLTSPEHHLLLAYVDDEPVGTDDENPAAVRAYSAGGGKLGDKPRSLEWTFGT